MYDSGIIGHYEARVLVPADDLDSLKCTRRLYAFEKFLLDRYDGFTRGALVTGRTREWGCEGSLPYWVYFCGREPNEEAEIIAAEVKYHFSQEAVYVAVAELVGPAIR